MILSLLLSNTNPKHDNQDKKTSVTLLKTLTHPVMPFYWKIPLLLRKRHYSNKPEQKEVLFRPWNIRGAIVVTATTSNKHIQVNLGNIYHPTKTKWTQILLNNVQQYLRT